MNTSGGNSEPGGAGAVGGLVDHVAQAAGLARDQAELATGAILGAVRLSAPGATFDPVERAIPDAQRLILGTGTVIGGGRTGEIVSMVSELRTNGGVLRLAGQLGRAGLTPDQVGKAAKAVISYVLAREGEEALRPLLDALPGFHELVR
jgi:hypothetical protein